MRDRGGGGSEYFLLNLFFIQSSAPFNNSNSFINRNFPPLPLDFHLPKFQNKSGKRKRANSFSHALNKPGRYYTQVFISFLFAIAGAAIGKRPRRATAMLVIASGAGGWAPCCIS